MRLIIFLCFGFLSLNALAAERIVSLKPNLTEILFDLGQGDKLVGVTTYCDEPKEAQKIPKVADYIHINTEKLLLAKPTRVFASEENSLEKEIQFIRSHGIPVFVYPFGRLDSLKQSILEMGTALGVASKSSSLVNEINGSIKEIRESLKNKSISPQIMVIVGVNPLVVVGSQNIIDDVLSALDLGNVYRTSSARYPTVNIEDVLMKSPDIIFDLSMGDEEKTKKEHWEWLSRYQSIPAVKNKRYHVLNIRDFRPAPSLVRGLKDLQKYLLSL